MGKLTKEIYIKNNKILRKVFTKLDKADLEFLQLIAEGKINPRDKNSEIRFKQVVYHMGAGLSLWELIELRKSFKILMNL